LHHKARTTQESKVTIITAAEIQKGDLIRVTRDETTEDRKGSIIHEGVAAVRETDYKGQTVWRTEKRNNLWVHEDGVVIELLDRPKPKIVLPTGKHAQVTYSRAYSGDRLAVLTPKGLWKCYDLDGEWKDTQDHKRMEELLNNHRQIANVKVLFEGVK
jgi:hypothetical protein